MKLVRWLARFGLSLAGIFAGGVWGGCGVPMYGAELMYMPTPPSHDPTVTIEDFSYTPVNTAPPGTRIVFRATTSKPTNAGYVTMHFGNPTADFFHLYDNGYAPDSAAEDGIWSGEWTVPDDAQPGLLAVSVHLDWWDGFSGLEFSGLPLTIIDGEDDPQ